MSDAYNLPDLYRALATTSLKHTPGAEWEYSNYGYALLGHVVERVSGTPYEQVLRTRLLTPLGMRESGVTMTRAQAERLAAFYWADDESRTEQSLHARYGDVAGFIGMTSTVRDLAQFVMAHTGATAAGRAAIAPSVARQMVEPQVRLDSTNAFYHVDMGLGWFREVLLDASDATPLLWHYGNVDGHASALFLRPQEGIGVIVLQNVGEPLAAQSTEQIGRWLMQRAVAETEKCRRRT